MPSSTLPTTPFTILVATDAAGGIGIHNTLPWHLPADLAHFKRLTTGHTIIMGRKTFDSIGKPLPNRRSIVITRNPDWQHAGVESVPSLTTALQLAGDDQMFVIGGAQIFAEALPHATRLELTRIEHQFECDTFLPPLDLSQWHETARVSTPATADSFSYAFITYQRKTN
ncbi:MAG: dihydrofolate reductase [Herbaspirillum sp.]